MGVGYGAQERFRATPKKNSFQTRPRPAQPGRPKIFPGSHSVRAILNLLHKIPRSIILDFLVCRDRTAQKYVNENTQKRAQHTLLPAPV